MGLNRATSYRRLNPSSWEMILALNVLLIVYNADPYRMLLSLSLSLSVLVYTDMLAMQFDPQIFVIITYVPVEIMRVYRGLL